MINNNEENEVNIEDAFEVFCIQSYNIELKKIQNNMTLKKEEQHNNNLKLLPISPNNILKQQQENTKIKQKIEIKSSSPISITHNIDEWPIQKLSRSSKEFVPYSYKKEHNQKIVQENNNEINLPKIKSKKVETTPTLSHWGVTIGKPQVRPDTSKEKRKEKLINRNFIENLINFHNNHYVTKSEHKININS